MKTRQRVKKDNSKTGKRTSEIHGQTRPNFLSDTCPDQLLLSPFFRVKGLFLRDSHINLKGHIMSLLANKKSPNYHFVNIKKV